MPAVTGMRGSTFPEASCAECSVGFAALELRHRSDGVKQDCCAVSAAASHEASHSAFAKAPIFLPNYLHTHPNSPLSYGDESACSQQRDPPRAHAQVTSHAQTYLQRATPRPMRDLPDCVSVIVSENARTG